MPLTVVIADDFPDGVEMLATYIRLDGHTVEVATDGKQAFELIEKHRPEVAFLDIGMPKMNGREVARHVRSQHWGKTIYLVAMTGYVQPADRAAAELAGFDAFLEKPPVPEQFLQICRERKARGDTNG